VNVKKLLVLTPEIKMALAVSMQGEDQYFDQAIKQNICELWVINNGESYAITRLEENNENGITLVLCCYEGKDIDCFSRHIIKIADSNKWAIRVHTYSKVLKKWCLTRYGFNNPEFVLKRSKK